MRRWNGWGDDTFEYVLPALAARFLQERVGAGVIDRVYCTSVIAWCVPPVAAHMCTRTAAWCVHQRRSCVPP